MKRKNLVRLLVENDCEILRHGSRHDIYVNSGSGKRAPVPRHSEIPETLVKIILKQLGIDSH